MLATSKNVSPSLLKWHDIGEWNAFENVCKWRSLVRGHFLLGFQVRYPPGERLCPCMGIPRLNAQPPPLAVALDGPPLRRHLRSCEAAPPAGHSLLPRGVAFWEERVRSSWLRVPLVLAETIQRYLKQNVIAVLHSSFNAPMKFMMNWMEMNYAKVNKKKMNHMWMNFMMMNQLKMN